jgi:chloride channel 7
VKKSTHCHVIFVDSVPLELYCAKDVMACPPVVLRARESVIRLSELLLNTNHGGFPVVRRAASGEDVFFGSINR